MIGKFGGVSQVKARADQALGQKELWRALLQDSYEYFLPQKEVWNEYSPGYQKTNKIFDSTGQVAIKEFANRMMMNITPQGTVWAKLIPGLNHPKEVREDPEILRTLEDINETLFSYINNSNFYTTMGEAYLDLALGTAALTVEEGNLDNPLVFELINQAEVGYEAGPSGIIENIYRNKSHKARNLPRAYPNGNFSSKIKEQIEKDPTSDVLMLECMLFDPKEGRYWIIVLQDQDVIWEIDRGTATPWPAFRWSVTPGEVRGRGPALDALQDVKTLNKVEEFALQKAAIELAGLWTGQDDGLFNPYTVDVQPGVVIPVSTNLTTNPSLARLDTGGPLQLTQFEVGRMQTAIRTHLYNDLRDPTGPVRSATEIAIQQRELANRIGSSFGRIQNEALVRILNSSASTLQRRGLLPSFAIDGRDFDVKFTSPLSRAQDQEEIQNLTEALSLSVQMVGPEATAANYKMDKVPTWIGRKTGVDNELLRSNTEREAALKEMSEMMQQGGVGGEQIQ
jgi:hypothetical protein